MSESSMEPGLKGWSIGWKLFLFLVVVGAIIFGYQWGYRFAEVCALFGVVSVWIIKSIKDLFIGD
jgi:hypothetical protein